jgi:hypothetical protein
MFTMYRILGIAYPDRVQLLEKFYGRKYVYTGKDTLLLYHLLWYISIEFTKINGIPKKRIVPNPYFMNNPLYEAFDGYAGYSRTGNLIHKR